MAWQTKHDLSREYAAEIKVWFAAVDRCHNKSSKGYDRYGGRGITVCERWRESFENFFADMGPRPSTDHSLDRINNDGNYEPTNCRWATRSEQASNRRTGVVVTAHGRSMTIHEWSRETGLNYTTIRNRLAVGWSPEEAVSNRRYARSAVQRG